MKILMLGWELPPHNNGGLGVACFQLCKALAARGVEIDFVVPYNDQHPDAGFMNILPALPFTAEEVRTGGGAYDSWRLLEADDLQVPPPEIPGDLRQQQQRYTEAAQLLATKNQYDAIHAHDWLTFEAATAIKQSANLPLIAHVHATEFDRSGEDPGNPVVHDIEYTTLCLADRVIAVSQATKDIIASEYQIPEDKIEVVHNSIDTTALQPLDTANSYAYLQLMKAYGYTVVVSLGRLTVQKGLTHLLRAAKLVVERNPKVLFLVAGGGEQYHELLELSAELGIAENILFTGEFVRGKAWRDAFAVADMFVLPSVSEPFGITPLEAIGYGSVILLSSQSGVGEVLHNVLKFDYWDTQRLADQILAVTEYDTLRSALYQNSYAEFRRLSWHDVAEKCNEIYQRTLQNNGAVA